MFKFGNLARQRFVESTKIDPVGEENVFMLRATTENDWPRMSTGENLEYLNNAIPTSFSPYNKNKSWYFDGVDDYITVNSNFALGANDFTVEFFCRFVDSSLDVIDRRILSQSNQLITGFQVYVTSADISITGEVTVTGGIVFANDVAIVGTIDAINDDEWHHIVFQKVGTTITSYVDGIEKQSVTGVINLSTTTAIRIGSDVTTPTSGNFEGWLSNIRINVSDIAYPDGVTVPTEPLTPITGTQMLACNRPFWAYEASDNRFSSSINGAFLVVDGPFDDSDENYISSVGNAGTNSVLKTIDDPKWELSGGNYTIEGWLMPIDSSGGPTTEFLAVWGPGGYNLFWGKAGYYGGWSHFQSSFYTRTAVGYNPNFNAWHHFVINRNAGTISIRFDGSHYGGATTANRNWGSYIGFGTSAAAIALADVRITKGEALFPNAAGNYDLPTEPISIDYRSPSDTNNVLMLGIDETAIKAGRSFFNRGKAKHVSFHAYPSNGPKPSQVSPFTTNAFYMLRLGGSGQVETPETSALRITAGQAFTWEMWVYLENTNAPIMIMAPNRVAYNDDTAIVLTHTGATVRTGNTGTNNGTNRSVTYPEGATVSLNEWNHIILTRDDNDDLRLYLNGVPGDPVAGPGVIQTNLTRSDLTGPSGIRFGRNAYINWTSSGDAYLTGYICNARLIKGRSVVPDFGTAPRYDQTPNTDDTEFLAFSAVSSATSDLSDNQANITYGSSTSLVNRLVAGEPFVKRTTFNPERNGGSVRMVVNQYLRAIGNGIPIGFRDFTIECWVYSFSWSNGNRTIFDGKLNGTNGFYPTLYVRQASGVVDQLFYYSNGATRISGPTLYIDQWYHIAVTRTNGVTRMFVNGQKVGADYADNNYYLPIIRPFIGADNGVNVWNGYISNFRFCVGESLYSENFPLPTFAPTKTDKTQILLTFNNNNINDLTNQNALLQSTDADTKMRVTNDVAIKKFTGAVTFNGTDDFLTVPHTNNQNQLLLGLGKFTIELWYYIAAGDMTTNRGLIGKGSATTGWSIQLNNTGQVLFYYGSAAITSLNSTTPNSWNHVAIVREGLENAQTRMYLNGVLESTGLVNTDFNQTDTMYIGADRTGATFFKGYIDSIRITKNIARYSGLSFDVPQAPFPER